MGPSLVVSLLYIYLYMFLFSRFLLFGVWGDCILFSRFFVGDFFFLKKQRCFTKKQNHNQLGDDFLLSTRNEEQL